MVIGKHNWHVIDTINGAEASAICFSIVETTKANRLMVHSYLEYLLEEIPKHMNDTNTEFVD